MLIGCESIIKNHVEPFFPIVKEYRAITSFAFPIQESEEIAAMLLKGTSQSEISEQVIVNNIFSIRSLSSRQGVLRTINTLFSDVSIDYLRFLAKGNSEVRRFSFLLMTLRINRLLREVISECLNQQRLSLQSFVGRRELKIYFLDKREQELDLQGWSEPTFQKAVSNTILILLRSGLLKPTEKNDIYEINAMPIPRVLRDQMVSDRLEHYFSLLLN